MRHKVLLIGAGKIAGLLDSADTSSVRSHAQGIKLTKALELVGAVDPSLQAREGFSHTHGVPCFESLDEALNLQPDIVSICTPDATHAEYLLRLSKVSKPPRLVIVEKPLCTSQEQLESLRKSNFSFPVVVNQSRRFLSHMQQLQSFLKSEPLGKLKSARFVYYGGWFVNAVHALDQFIFLSSSDLKHIRLSSVKAGRPGDFLIEGEAEIWNKSERRGVLKFEAVDEADFQLFEMELRFGSGRVYLRDFANEINIEGVEENYLGERELMPGQYKIHKEGPAPILNLYAQAAEYCENKLSKSQLRSGLDDVIGSMLVLFAVMSQAK